MTATLLAIALVLLISYHGLTLHGAAVAMPPIPGITLVDDDPTPVVTSLRSDSEAERAGLRVGDHIAAVDGRPVRSVAALRAAVDGRDGGPVALHVSRGNAVWTVALDRAEPEIDATQDGKTHHDAQNPAG